MKKQILASIVTFVLVFVLLLSFSILVSMMIAEPIQNTETVAETTIETQPEVQIEAPTEVTEPQDPYKIPDCLEFVDFETVEAMTLEEVNALSENLVHMSKTAYLSRWDMYEMGTMFNFIWDYPEYDKVKFEKEFCEAFDNVCQHATEIGSTFDILEPWIDTPVAEVMCKYLSSSNFEKPVEIWSRAINQLSEEDLALVTEALFKNPTMAVNADIARSIICATDNEDISNMAWAHLLRLSSSDAVHGLKSFYTGYICFDIFTNQDLVYEEEIILEKIYNNENITQIAKNILSNPSFDFVGKYGYFCTDFFYGSDVDIEISQMALDSLEEYLASLPKTKQAKLACDLYEETYNRTELSSPLNEQYREILINAMFEFL